MESVAPSSARHESSRKLVNDDHLALLDYIIHIPFEQGIGPESLIHVVKRLNISRVIKVFDMDQFLHMSNALFRQKGRMALLFELIILFPFQEGNDPIDLVIFIGRFFRRTGDDERGPGLIDQNAVHLIDNGVVQLPLDIIFNVKFHIIAKVVKPELVIRPIGDVAAISDLSFFIVQFMEDDAYRET